MIAHSMTTFSAAGVGLRSSTPRCSAISITPGEYGTMEGKLTGHPLIDGTTVRLTRGVSEVWSCQGPTGSMEKHRPSGCS